MPVLLLRRLRKSVRKRGLWRTAALGLRHTVTVALNPAVRYARYRWSRLERDFDRRYGVDTSGILPVTVFNVAGAHVEHANPYVGTDPRLFREMLGRVPVQYPDYVFIDFGSGKGRCLLLASEWPFRRVLGVEFTPELHAIARENLRRFRGESRRCTDVASVCADAAAFPLPPEPAVYYFFNPFRRDVMAAVLRNLKQSLAECPRDMVCIYHHPVERELWDRLGCLRRVVATDEYVIYRSRTEVIVTAGFAPCGEKRNP